MNEIKTLPYPPAKVCIFDLQKIIIAVLAQAVRDVQGNNLELQQDAREWLQREGKEWAEIVGLNRIGIDAEIQQ
jgi:hypothetical protein